MKKLLSIFFATLMLLSNMGFSISSHYCRGKLVKSELVHGANSSGCCMAKMDNKLPKDCHSPKVQQPIKKKNCCENTYQNLEIDDEFNSKQIVSKANPQWIAAIIYVYLQLNFPESKLTTAYTDYSPPPLQQDIQVLYQIFLI